VFPKFEGLDDDGLLRDFDATLDHLHESGWTSGSIGAVGFCFGGRASFLLAVRRALGASVGFYGGGIVSSPFWPPLVGEAASLQTPWLGLFGDKDESIPVDDVEALRTALKGASVETEIVRYPDAGHGFHCDVRTTHYEANAAADAWARTLAWFDTHLGG
jgi:carboxymethylenebutenolidase